MSDSAAFSIEVVPPLIPAAATRLARFSAAHGIDIPCWLRRRLGLPRAVARAA